MPSSNFISFFFNFPDFSAESSVINSYLFFSTHFAIDVTSAISLTRQRAVYSFTKEITMNRLEANSGATFVTKRYWRPTALKFTSRGCMASSRNFATTKNTRISWWSISTWAAINAIPCFSRFLKRVHITETRTQRIKAISNVVTVSYDN